MSNEDGEILNETPSRNYGYRGDDDRDREIDKNRDRDRDGDRNRDRDRDGDRNRDRGRDSDRNNSYNGNNNSNRDNRDYTQGERCRDSDYDSRDNRSSTTATATTTRDNYKSYNSSRDPRDTREYKKDEEDKIKERERSFSRDRRGKEYKSRDKSRSRSRDKKSSKRKEKKYSSSEEDSSSSSEEDRKKRNRKSRNKRSPSPPKSKPTSTTETETNKPTRPTTATGVYIPPFKLAMMQKQVQDKSSPEYQRMEWDALRKSINGLINKVSYSNVKNIAVELFSENIIRGRGLLCNSIMVAQQVSLPFTNVYAALMAIINTKIPDIGELLLKRLIDQFKKSFRRNDKPICIASTKFIAHLTNQQVCGILVPLEILTLLLDKPTDDSVEVAVDFFLECGLTLQELSPQTFNSIFSRFKAILHEGEIEKRTQYQIEELFKQVRSSFSTHPAIIPELDVVEIEDQITHDTLSIEEQYNPETNLNFFKVDDKFLENQQQYNQVKRSILGDDSSSEDDNGDDKDTDSDDSSSSDSDDDDEEKKSNYRPPSNTAGTVINTTVIEDKTDTNLINLRKTIYLAIMSSKDFEECAHKLLRLKIKDHEDEICNMLIQCCSQERTYLPFYGNLSQRFCMINKIYRDLFDRCFAEQYAVIHRLETNRFRNIAKMYAHLFFTDALPWTTLQYVHINEDETNSASRIFIKILFQEMAEFLGIQKLNERLQDPSLQDAFAGIFPKDNPKNTRYAINFFTSISLGALTHDLREFLKNAPKVPLIEKKKQVDSSSSDSSDSDSSDSDSSDSDSSSSDSSSSSSSSDSSSEDERRRKKSRR